jgi:hypothetical protein
MYYRKRLHTPKGIIRYNYLPEFDNAPCKLEDAFELYEYHGLCHIFQDGVLKCYQEFDELEPDEYQIEDLVLTDFI